MPVLVIAMITIFIVFATSVVSIVTVCLCWKYGIQSKHMSVYKYSLCLSTKMLYLQDVSLIFPEMTDKKNLPSNFHSKI